jgi:hypothetical protein
MSDIKESGNHGDNVIQPDTRLHDMLGKLVQDQNEAHDRSDPTVFILQKSLLDGKRKVTGFPIEALGNDR